MEQHQWERLCQWISDAGAAGMEPASCAVKPGLFDMGGESIRGLAATKDLQPKDVLMSVPIYCTIVAEEIAQPFDGASWGASLAAKVFQEQARGEESPFYAYLQTLPPSATTTVLAQPHELAEVQYEPMAARIQDLTLRFQHDFDQCPPFALEGASWVDFVNVLATIYSRTFRINGRRYLIPAVDQLNHTVGEHQAEWRLDEAEGVINVVATAPVPSGGQLFASYGHRSNDDFLLFYGFVPAKNPADDVEVFNTVDAAVEWAVDRFAPDDPTAARAAAAAAAAVVQSRMEAEERETEAAEGMAFEVVAGQRPSEMALRVLRSGEVDGRLMAALEALHSAGGGVHPLEAIVHRCAEVLSEFPTTAEDDVGILQEANAELSDLAKLLIRYRIGKKVVLMTVIELCNQELASWQEDRGAE
uniref:Rubisco LSMT substrate-binding domain-containing protein n=1 Tax=Pyramimonas obovata TaxID=1411642 RepID=A0A7S0QT59_9CHLO|mmetsp:Transcript_19248/g.42117  ORF Transcript_19248/g.42117 Transcript_19248/m.42117 type:complete len:417 (+) Transcript_19248:196-1446(+)|eukprot:CAMPEP_0118961184 /NCGR_PEP_ID=MMETSP1169-20130426/64010_1 /TAXON_ID=36882 /ORGANISM="Pyramimonas obovata, Strain CCMP722" /LENGTH=416 /DNA_ID=CAMNT_0006909335 /DNA_START=141 /DNA_END=1391 /DNA_ORIENTATION=+